ncbi:MAG: hypothetical protein GTN49_05350 [candidate division Zixibacteria bacterium]|nr:hypothetical protein [candidate division Zixibacteria bacterium]
MAEESVTSAEWEERGRRLLDLLEPLAITYLYFNSVLSWLWGLVFGLVALTRCKLEANKRVGGICIILAIVNFVLIGCLVAACFLMIAFAAGLWASRASPSGGG